MFKLSMSETFWAPVEVEFGAEKGGKATVKFEAQFKRYTIDDMEVLQERIRSEQMDDRAIAREVMVGWRDVMGDDGQALAFNEESREAMLRWGFGGAIALSFFGGAPKAKVKN